jgi:hypothetical protein
MSSKNNSHWYSILLLTSKKKCLSSHHVLNLLFIRPNRLNLPVSTVCNVKPQKYQIHVHIVNALKKVIVYKISVITRPAKKKQDFMEFVLLWNYCILFSKWTKKKKCLGWSWPHCSTFWQFLKISIQNLPLCYVMSEF